MFSSKHLNGQEKGGKYKQNFGLKNIFYLGTIKVISKKLFIPLVSPRSPLLLKITTLYLIYRRNIFSKAQELTTNTVKKRNA